MKFLNGIDLASRRITNVADPTSAQDAATKAYVDAKIGTVVSGVLASNQNTSGSANTLTDLLTTPSLAVGTWLLTFNVQAVGATYVGVKVVAGTATATFAGPTAIDGGGTNVITISLTTLVTVTSAGTVKLQVEASGANTTITAGPRNYTANGSATGYVGVKVA